MPGLSEERNTSNGRQNHHSCRLSSEYTFIIPNDIFNLIRIRIKIYSTVARWNAKSSMRRQWIRYTCTRRVSRKSMRSPAREPSQWISPRPRHPKIRATKKSSNLPPTPRTNKTKWAGHHEHNSMDRVRNELRDNGYARVPPEILFPGCRKSRHLESRI